MSRCRFLVDECVPRSLVRGMRRRLADVDVIHVGETNAPPKGTSDPDLLEICETQHRLFLTADRATIPTFVKTHLNLGRHTWGVLVVSEDVSIGHLLDELSLVYEASEDTDWMDVLYYLPFSA
jgi:hypothetical protein